MSFSSHHSLPASSRPEEAGGSGAPLDILVVDDHEIVRTGVRATLRDRPEWRICGEAGDGRSALALMEQCEPDVVLMDVGMPRLDGIRATRVIRERWPRTRVVILTMNRSEQLLAEAIDAGASAFVLKSDVIDTLVAVIDSLGRSMPAAGGEDATELDRCDAWRRWGARQLAARAHSLSRREREILRLMAEGSSIPRIAETLEIGVKTAETHRANAMRKLGMRSVMEMQRALVGEDAGADVPVELGEKGRVQSPNRPGGKEPVHGSDELSGSPPDDATSSGTEPAK